MNNEIHSSDIPGYQEKEALTLCLMESSTSTTFCSPRQGLPTCEMKG